MAACSMLQCEDKFAIFVEGLAYMEFVSWNAERKQVACERKPLASVQASDFRFHTVDGNLPVCPLVWKGVG
eukprot:687870-Rhodomonas_salina.1